MSTILDKVAENYKFHIERYDSAMEVVEKCRSRQMTSSSFHDMQNGYSYSDWNGVKSYEEALDYMKNGYQPAVESMRGVFKATASGYGKRFSFQNQMQGFAPVVPLALKGVPNSMIGMTMKPIKAKVIDIYYDMVAGCSTDSDDIIKAGTVLLGTVLELEKQGYRFNIYSCQTYAGRGSADMLIVKVKDAAQPLDLKRTSFPLTHTGFFRTIGFDWYSKVPGGTYRSAYGHALSYDMSPKKASKAFEEMFGNKAIYFSAKEILESGKDYIRKEVENNGNSKA